MRDLDKQEIKEIIESHDEKLVDELIHLVKESNVSLGKTKKEYSFGDMVSDKIAAFAGSWTFIISFIIILISWIAYNLVSSNPKDPFPFILLNLMLSMVAAIQAPLIMMSQNREEEKNEEKATTDFFVNIKSELLIEDIHSSVKNIEEKYERILEILEKNE